MLFKGKKYRRSSKVFPLPREMWANDGAYVTFGRMCDKDAKGAVKSDYSWNDERGAVYLKPVKARGHSLTNLMYGADGYSYLMLDGCVYVAKTKDRNKETYCDKVYEFEGDKIRPLFYETEVCKEFEESVRGLEGRKRRKAFLNHARAVFASLCLDSTAIKFNKHKSKSFYYSSGDRATFSESLLDSPARFFATVIHEAAHAFEDLYLDPEDCDGKIHGRLFVHSLIKFYARVSGLDAEALRLAAKQSKIGILSHAKYVDGSDSFFDQFEDFSTVKDFDTV